MSWKPAQRHTARRRDARRRSRWAARASLRDTWKARRRGGASFAWAGPRATKANLLGALLAIALGSGIATQVQLTNERGLTSSARRTSSASSTTSRCDPPASTSRSASWRRPATALQSGTGTPRRPSTGPAAAPTRWASWPGPLPAQGPGITVRISDPDSQVTGPVVLDLIQELRDGGAESIDVGGVRVVASRSSATTRATCRSTAPRSRGPSSSRPSATPRRWPPP